MIKKKIIQINQPIDDKLAIEMMIEWLAYHKRIDLDWYYPARQVKDIIWIKHISNLNNWKTKGWLEWERDYKWIEIVKAILRRSKFLSPIQK